jgi:16S rRNA G1207 methylase RsmC
MVYTIVVHLYAKDDEESLKKLTAKLIEASRVYSQDKETLSWHVMQSTSDKRAFTIVERYEQESVRIESWNVVGVFANVFCVAEPGVSLKQPLLEDF